MSSLKLNFKDVYTEIARYLGIQSLTDAAEITKCKDIVYRGYRRFLMPVDVGAINQFNRAGKIHHWKFLERTTTLSIESGVDTYKLPLGFSSFVTPFTYTSSVTVNPVQRTLAYIYEQKSQTSTSGYPMYFALKDGNYDEINGQQYCVVFWPTPSSAQTFYYVYIFTPPSPVNDDDVFVGDELTSECILECALAVAEIRKTDKAGVHSQESENLIQRLIGVDKQASLTPFLGMMTNGTMSKVSRNPVIYDQNMTQILP